MWLDHLTTEEIMIPIHNNNTIIKAKEKEWYLKKIEKCLRNDTVHVRRVTGEPAKNSTLKNRPTKLQLNSVMRTTKRKVGCCIRERIFMWISVQGWINYDKLLHFPVTPAFWAFNSRRKQHSFQNRSCIREKFANMYTVRGLGWQYHKQWFRDMRESL